MGKEGLARKITYRDFERVQGVWTARTIQVFDPKQQSTTTLRIEKLEYNLPLPDQNFTLQALRREG